MDDRGALRRAYHDLDRLVAALDEAGSWRATGCPGWAVRDLVQHLLADAQRALVALARPVDGPPDRDAVSYWRAAPGGGAAGGDAGDDDASRHLRATRTMASAWRLDRLVTTYGETARAVVHLAGRTAPEARVRTQGHVLTAGDLVTTLVVEAAVHHLDLVVDLEGPGPAAAPLAVVRRTLDGLLGEPVPVDWDDATYALTGTGRRRVTVRERRQLGPLAERFPLLG